MLVGQPLPGRAHLQWRRDSPWHLHPQVTESFMDWATKLKLSHLDLNWPRWLRLKTYHWRGLYEIPTYRSLFIFGNSVKSLWFSSGARSSVSSASSPLMGGLSSNGIPSPALKGILHPNSFGISIHTLYLIFLIFVFSRWFAIICLVTGFLITELNTFYLK